VIPLFVQTDALRACMPAHARLTLEPLPSVPTGYHPILIELWQIRNGVIRAGSFNAHHLSEMAGTLGGMSIGGTAGATVGAGMGSAAGAASAGALGIMFGPLGWLMAVTGGAAAGGVAGAAWGASTGAIVGAQRTAHVARTISEAHSRVVGTYGEVIVTVPCRWRGKRGSASDHAFVLGSYTDSIASVLGDRFLGWCYGKTGARIDRMPDVLELYDTDTTPTMTVTMQRPARTPAIETTLGHARHIIDIMRAPLLGRGTGTGMTMALLERTFTHNAIMLTPMTARVEAGNAFLPGLPAVSANVNATASDAPWGAFAFTNVPVALSYPVEMEP